MQRKRRRKNEERKSKKITGYLYISYGSHDLFRTASAGGNTQDVYNSAGKNLDKGMILPAMERKTGLRLSGKKVSMMGAGTVQIFM